MFSSWQASSLCLVLLSVCLLALDVYSTVCTDSAHRCQEHGYVLAWSTYRTQSRTGGSEFPSCTFQTDSKQATGRAVLLGKGWVEELGVRWSWVCHQFTNRGLFNSHRTLELQRITPNSPSEVWRTTPTHGCRCNDLDSPGCCGVLTYMHK